MYQGKPILKKIKYTNYHNPSLNSQGMKGVFYDANVPVLVRDELRYNLGFKDSLQQTVEQEQFKRRNVSTFQKQISYDRSISAPVYEPQMRYNKKEVMGKVTQKQFEQQFNNFNYKGYKNIKTKQNHGFDIIKNF